MADLNEIVTFYPDLEGQIIGAFVTNSFACSMGCREHRRENCCGNPACETCNDGRRRGVYVEHHS